MTTTRTEPHGAATEKTPEPTPAPGSISVTGKSNSGDPVAIGGSVPATLILLATAALHTHTITLARVPPSNQIEQMIALMNRAGCEIRRGRKGEITVKGLPAAADRAQPHDTPDLFEPDLNPAALGPGAVHLIPALLHRYGCAILPWALAEPVDDVLAVYKEFGDSIATRPEGYSIVAAEATYATVEIAVRTRAAAPTVAAILRACVAGSRIVVHHPSRQHEIHALYTTLHKLGWRGHYSEDRLDLTPGPTPWPVLNWPVPGDQFEAAACVCALAAIRRTGTITGVVTSHLTVLRMLLAQAGARVHFADDHVKVAGWGPPKPGWRGFAASAGTEPRELPSDHLALLIPIASGILGHHSFTDTTAAGHTTSILNQLRAFGLSAELGSEPGHGTLTGPAKPTAPREMIETSDPIEATALAILACTATGTTAIGGIDLLHHAHPTLIGNLRKLGASIIKGGAQ